jgi:hypothetical protein
LQQFAYTVCVRGLFLENRAEVPSIKGPILERDVFLLTRCTVKDILRFSQTDLVSQKVLVLSEEEKTAVFWLGLVVFGYSAYEFCIAGWQFLNFSGNFAILEKLWQIFPPIIGGLIFLIIALIVMNAGIGKAKP